MIRREPTRRSSLAAALLGLVLCAAPAAADSLAEARARGTLRVCIWPDYYSISYRNPRSGEYEGIDIDLARGFASRLGLGIQFVLTDFRAFMDRLEARACELAMFGVGITEARATRVDFAAPYLSSPIFGVTTPNNPVIRAWADIDRPGNQVAVAAGTFMEPVMRGSLREATLVSIAPPQTREGELQSGRVDVFMSDYPYTRRLAMLGQAIRIVEPPPGFGETRYAPAVPKGDAAMLEAINGFIAAARADGTLARAAERHGLTPILLR